MAFNRAGFTQAAKSMGYTDAEIEQVATLREAQENNPKNIAAEEATRISQDSARIANQKAQIDLNKIINPPKSKIYPSTINSTTGNTAVTTKSGFDREAAKANGYTDEEIDAYLGISKKNNTINKEASSLPPIEPKSLEGFVGNIGKSTVRGVKDIASAAVNIFNPNMDKNTIANLAKLGIDTAKLIGGDKSENNRAKAVGEFYKNRYGSLDNAINTIYEDPFGVALDASIVADLGGSIAGKAGELTKISGLAKAGEGLSKAGEVINPLSGVSKLAKGAVEKTGIGKVAGKAGEAVDAAKTGAAEFLAKRSTKGTGSQFVNFAEKADQDIGKWMVDQKIYDVSDAEKAIKPLQENYDKLVRSGKKINGSVFANNLRQKGIDIISKDQSPSARQLADKLWNEADIQEKLGDVTDTVLTNTKSNSFAQAPKGSIIDPMSDNFNKVMGSVGIQTLEQVAPGSAEIGKKLQALQEFKSIIKKQSEVGKGSQIINILKPSVSGGIAGAAAGSFLPGIGNLGGAAIGAGGAILANSPQAQRFASKVLTTPMSLPPIVGKAGQMAGKIGVAGRTLTPEGVTPLPQIGPQTISEQDTSYNNDIPKTESSQMSTSTYRTGNSPEYWNEQMILASREGDDTSYNTAKDQRDTEIAHQKTIGTSKEPVTIDRFVDKLSQYYFYEKGKSLSQGKNTVGISGGFSRLGQESKKAFNQDYVDNLMRFNNMRSIFAGMLNRARGAGTLNAGEYETVIQNMPNEYSSDKVAKAWFDDTKQLLKGIDISKAQVSIQSE